MKILVDGYWAVSGPPSGKIVLAELLNAWTQSYPEDNLILAVPSPELEIAKGLYPELQVAPTLARVHPLINAFELPALRSRFAADGIFAQNFAPTFGRSVTLIHDVLFQSNPEWFTRRESLYCSLIPTLARATTLVIPTSVSEKSRIAHHNPSLRIGDAIGLTVSTALSSARPASPNLPVTPGRFALTVGRLNIRKNLATTIRAGLKSGIISQNFPLVIVGEESGALERWPELVQQAIQDGSILFAGFLSDAQLRWLYEKCSFLCFLSLDEGFGLPPVEAAAFGTPVLVSDIRVMHENIGSYGVYSDPRSEVSIVDGFRTIASRPRGVVPARDPGTWSQVVSKLRKQAQKEFTKA